MDREKYKQYGNNLLDKLENYTTVEEVETDRCNDCSEDGHYGWCDAPWIVCPWKARIKEILGETDSRFKSIAEHISTIKDGR